MPLLIGLVVAVPACSFGGGGATTLDAGPPSPTPALSDLSGSWENESVILRVNDAGDYVVLAVDVAEEEGALTGGFVARDDVHFIFVTGIGGECPGQAGVYETAIEDDVLTLTLVEDPCVARATWFEPPFTRAS